MLWYSGKVAEAVQLAKQRNAVFVVFVEGNNDASKKLLETVEDDLVASKLSDQNKFLVIRLKSSSEDYMHFARIYQFVPEPCMFFIGRGGVPLEVVCDGIDAQKLAERVDKIHLMHVESAVMSGPSGTSVDLKNATQNLIQKEQQRDSNMAHSSLPGTSSQSANAAVKPPQDFEVVCNDGVCIKVPKKADTKAANEEEPASEPQREPSIEEKMEKARQLIELKKREKEIKEKEEEKKKEVERRNVGKGVAELKQWQKEQEFKQFQEEQKKAKADEIAARQRVLAQIAQDKEDRKAKFAQNQNPGTSGDTAQAAPRPLSVPQQPASNSARIQLKLSDGTSHTSTFEADSTLAELRLYIRDNVKITGVYSLWVAFPRRELTAELDAETLRQLGLAPSACILVLTRSSSGGVAPATLSTFTRIYTIITTLMTSMIVEPVTGIFRWISTTLLGATATPRPGMNPINNPRPASTAAYSRRIPNESQGTPLGGAQSHGESGPRLRRIIANNPDQDDLNTYNGNSTQQL